MSDIQEWILRQFELLITFDRQSELFENYKDKEIYNCFNMLALVVKLYIFLVNIKVTQFKIHMH